MGRSAHRARTPLLKKLCLFLSLICSLLLVSGCREEPFDPSTLVPVTQTAVVGDFELRATASGTACPRKELGSITYTVDFLYVGELPEVTAVNPLFSVHPEPCTPDWNLVNFGELSYTVLKQGELRSQRMFLNSELRLDKGEHTMAVVVHLDLGTETLSYTFRFPLTVT